MEWLPIESAPKDGGTVLLWADPEVFIASKRADDGTWWDGDWDWRIPATHWMPLPEPPQLEK